MTVLCGYIVEKQREWQGEEIPQELVYVSEGGEREDGEGEEKEKKEETEEEEGKEDEGEEEGEEGRRGRERKWRGGGLYRREEICFNLEGLPLKYNLTTSGSPRIRA